MKRKSKGSKQKRVTYAGIPVKYRKNVLALIHLTTGADGQRLSPQQAWARLQAGWKEMDEKKKAEAEKARKHQGGVDAGRLEDEMRALDEALDMLAEARDSAHAIATGHESAKYLTPETLARYIQLELVEAGTKLETALYNLGLLRKQKYCGHFLEKYPAQRLIPFSNLPKEPAGKGAA